MKNKRINRISEEIRKVVSELITREIKDPRVSPMTSITKVQVTNDLSYANIYVSVLGDKEVKEETLNGLTSAKGFVRKEISNRIDLRHAPEPIFHLDESIEHSLYISKLIEKVNREDEDKRGDRDE
ncbi:Ribosome-binding factor A [[Clostridium] ultunense Esp]|uniref:Ribosome-binding factor A n=1 Tax=[Clostridium] ultunense Esp TaxID=1288971 RepID=M1Z4U7_9FIRM|nr:30S ribosome-binding factor RbfA [Schnuerera ultunensis]CCQ93056.1 Ribosome-binding factor A [[Clostridium] ultunense Esp]SHD77060.1 pre-ribosomal (17S) RNA binding factor A [[Clostridium] ultunense Esp]